MKLYLELVKKNVNVLIVEDNVMDAELAEREIAKEFGTVRCPRVDTKEDYLAALDKFKPDLIVSDYVMPTFDGMTALKLALELVPDIPFIIFTGSMNEDTAVDCMKAGAWDYIIKEHMKRLGPAVRAALEEKQLRVEREKARQEAEKAYKVKSEFLANISHELRTPLNGILGMFSILERLELGKEGHYWLSMAKQSANNLNKIIIDLLNFIDLESKKISLERRPFFVEDIISSTLNLFRGEGEKKGLQLKYENRCTHAEFTGDGERAAQIVWHLLSNAVKFSEEGVVRVTTDENGNTLLIAVEDEGIGIEESKIEELFLPLQQLENPYTKTHSGVGLGLSLVKSLVDLMEGDIRVESVPGKGSRFEVRIPGTFQDRKEAGLGKPEKSSGSSEREKSGTILVVEDEAINRLYVCTLLRKHGFTVLEARNGEEAVETADTSHPELILMDIGLPVLDGVEASKRIHRNNEARDIPIIALTAHVQPAEKERFLRVGMVEVVPKPFQEQDLIAVVRKYLKNHTEEGFDKG